MTDYARGDWRHGCLSGLVCLLVAGWSVRGHAQTASPALFAAVRGALVLVKAGEGQGSGFIVELSGKRYFITNEHVLRGGRPFSAVLLDGTVLELGALEVAEDRDLVRFELPRPPPSTLALAEVLPNIGEAATVFGNSDGGGVATAIPGLILGVGPLFLETDAPFVGGNSGSPIVNARGEVLAVATFATRRPEPANWLKQGTRFANVRRFGVRLQETKWKALPLDQYMIRAEALADVERFCYDLYALRFLKEMMDPGTGLLVYDYARESKRFKRAPGLCKILADSVTAFNVLLTRHMAEYDQVKMAKAARTRMEFENQVRKLEMNRLSQQSAVSEFDRLYDNVRKSSLAYIRRNDWALAPMKEEAAFWARVIEAILEEK